MHFIHYRQKRGGGEKRSPPAQGRGGISFSRLWKTPERPLLKRWILWISKEKKKGRADVTGPRGSLTKKKESELEKEGEKTGMGKVKGSMVQNNLNFIPSSL